MKTLKDLTAELIIWLDSECPAVAPPLEPYDNSDLSHNFCELLRIRLDEINRLRSQVEQESGQILSPEEFLKLKNHNDNYYSPTAYVVRMMKEYHSQFGKVSDEMIEKFADKLSFGSGSAAKLAKLNWQFGAKAMRDGKIK